MKKLRKKWAELPLASKIRFSYLIVILPLVTFTLFSVVTLLRQNKRYDQAIESAGRASRFSLDFKKDFDYETYLVIVESKTYEESELENMLKTATDVVDELDKEGSLDSDNEGRLEDIRMYLKNLGTYTRRIRDNLQEGGRYEENIEIWENDVQIVTGLVRETIIQFIYYEIQDMQRVRNEVNGFYTKALTISFIAAVFIFILLIRITYSISRSITSPVLKLSQVTEKVAAGDLNVRANLDAGAELGVLSRSLDEMIERINMLIAQVRTEQENLRVAELELLQAQINPHFLYNTLDTIIWLAEAGDQKKVVSMVGSLSEFFRASLGQGRDIVTIGDEMKHVISYLQIQQVRYQDILSYSVDVPEELYDCLIPKITIQPIVENALYHGIKNKRGGGCIRITGDTEGSIVYLHVADDGIGMKEERLLQIRSKINIGEKTDNTNDASGNREAAEIFGLYNVNERIRLKFGDRYGIHIDSTYGEGTIVTVSLPKKM
ncbi:MAG: sensor histidine kinase [Lachnospiraceae bacterium]|nr:sensor histidine kinase [Lachnospiraceae bacterium]